MDLVSLGHIASSSLLPSRLVFLPLRFQTAFSFLVLEIRGLEPLTLGLQSRCSSQLS